MSRPFLIVVLSALAISSCSVLPLSAATVSWVDWVSGSAGPSGSAAGVLNLAGTTVNVSYGGEIAFIQTSTGTNYWTQGSPAPYVNSLVDNAPPAPDLIALSRTTSKTLSFSQPVSDLLFAMMSLNGNGYRFDRDFSIVSSGRGYWGIGTLARNDLGGGIYELAGSGEAHGVIRFAGAVSSITWTSKANEYWNGFTVGTYGLAPPVPEPGSLAALSCGLLGLVAFRRRR